jgi:serine-type D-Ala-D-Ala carboxypeptidase (penicillin-binding protein 5/6)
MTSWSMGGKIRICDLSRKRFRWGRAILLRGVCVPFAPLASFALNGSADLDAFALVRGAERLDFSDLCRHKLGMNKTLPLLLAFVLGASSALAQAISRDPYVGAIVVDAANGNVLFEDGADRPGYPASMIKLVNLFIVLDGVKAGTLRLDELVGVTQEAADMGGTQVWLDPRETFPLEELLYALIVASANDAAMAIAIHVGGSRDGFVRMMNEKVRSLGLSPITRFQSPHGLPPPKGQRPDMTTARDFAKLCVALLDAHPEALAYTSTTYRRFRGDPKPSDLHSRNRILKSLPGCDGLKTGFFRDAGFSISATAQRDGRRVIAVILGSADRKRRDALASELVNRHLPQATRVSTPPPVAIRPVPPPPPVPIRPTEFDEEEGEDAEYVEGQPEKARPEAEPEATRRGRAWGTLLGIAFVAAVVGMVVRRRLLVGR